MITVHFVHGARSYLPELAAYQAHIQSLGHAVQMHTQAHTVPDDAQAVWWICGRVPADQARRFKGAVQVHEYASASVAPLAWLKDRIKQWQHPVPDFRVFQSEWVRQRMGFGDNAPGAVPYALRDMGVRVKVLTGDNPIVTAKICREVGLEAGEPLLGRDIEHMDDQVLGRLVEERTVFAKLTPLQKSRVLKALQANGHTVGFLGDGINDAPALRDADVGISVDSGTDIAKESADIILLEKSLMVLEEGVLKGRETFGNIMKYLCMTASSNFGNVFSVLVASAFIPFLPMLAIHLLLQNLMYDFSQLSLPSLCSGACSASFPL